MAQFGLKLSKSEQADKTPYTVYYPHNKPHTERKWTQDYIQVVSIDPGRKNYAFRIERRYFNGWITPIVFDKVDLPASTIEGETTTTPTYQALTTFLNRFQSFYPDCHYIIIERQLPQNYKTTRLAQHTISYFSLRLEDAPLLPAIVEVSPSLKGKVLGAPRGLPNKELKKWAVDVARALLQTRRDDFSIGVLNGVTKKDDLSDTVCQAEALFITWGYPPTTAPPGTGVTLTMQPAEVLNEPAPPAPIAKQCANILSITQTAPIRPTHKTLMLNVQPRQ